ncbi:YchO/YchP family invasin [Ewingella sp. S1.OA.A_B6]
MSSVFYTACANALTVDVYQPLSHDVDLSAPAGDVDSQFNVGTPATDPNDLPSLGSAYYRPSSGASATATKIANALKQFGEQSTSSDSQDPLREQAETLALTQAAKLVQKETSSLLSPLGTASMSLDVSGRNLDGSSGQLFSPLHNSKNLLTYSQVGVSSSTDATVGNFGLGQRWSEGAWMLGYNAFVDNDFDHQLTRGSLGAEAWTDYLYFSTNYYHPFSSFQPDNSTSTQLRRQARGYDITTKGYLPFYRQIGASLSYEQYYGDRVDLFGNGTRQTNPSAMTFGVNYTPVPLVTVKAAHQAGQDGDNQDTVQLSLNYRLGVPLAQQLSANYVDDAHSLRGSRMDTVERNNVPVMDFKQRKTLSLFLATPPWTLQPGETLTLKLQVRALNRLTALSWQGDTQALSLTPPQDNRDTEGWSVIIPPWDSSPGASNSYHLSVTAVDSKQQHVTSNWITLNVSPPPLSVGMQDQGLNF